MLSAYVIPQVLGTQGKSECMLRAYARPINAEAFQIADIAQGCGTGARLANTAEELRGV